MSGIVYAAYYTPDEIISANSLLRQYVTDPNQQIS